ncbi:MAG: formylglycine-generating enzyme family protein [Chloroflexi bacterium]|nr:formylglycine-generating enzyme family protein [Chloroflexota bacterium]MCY3697031.1 formylglycine-generating enzyme family protein [Chloroflexota bacterium]
MTDCCAASRSSALLPFGTGTGGNEGRWQVPPRRPRGPARATARTEHVTAKIPDGRFVMGAVDELSYPGDGEGPLREVELSAFEIDACAVTNEEFAAFVEAMGYLTESEQIGWSFVFAGLLPKDFPPTRGAADAPWWRQVEGASWQSPEGPGSDIDARHDHPVVHVSWNDALAYAEWAGKSLPSEAQWERAARGELDSQPYPWGDELTPGGEHRMNVWQGVFPNANTFDDGWYGTCPVDSYEPNGFGLYNATGNVWEWCHDWFDVFHDPSPLRDPTGPPDGDLKVLKGGSFLCHESYCLRYRTAARQGLTPDSATSNTGFRCVRAT